jgi:hypothetical protein
MGAGKISFKLMHPRTNIKMVMLVDDIKIQHVTKYNASNLG